MRSAKRVTSGGREKALPLPPDRSARIFGLDSGSLYIPFAIVGSIDAYLPRDFRGRRPIELRDRAAGESLTEGRFFPPFKQQVRFVAAHADISDRTIEPSGIQCVPHRRVAMPVVADAAALPAGNDQCIGREMRVDVQPRTLVSPLETLQVEHAPGARFAHEEQQRSQCDEPDHRGADPLGPRGYFGQAVIADL